jgi:hypothetical protein
MIGCTSNVYIPTECMIGCTSNVYIPTLCWCRKSLGRFWRYVLKVFRTRMLVCNISITQTLPNNLPHGMVLVFPHYFWIYPNFWSTLRQIPREGLSRPCKCVRVSGVFPLLKGQAMLRHKTPSRHRPWEADEATQQSMPLRRNYPQKPETQGKQYLVVKSEIKLVECSCAWNFARVSWVQTPRPLYQLQLWQPWNWEHLSVTGNPAEGLTFINDH